MEPEGMTEQRYEISILVGPCSQEAAELLMVELHGIAVASGGEPGTSLNHWDEDDNCPGLGVEDVDVL